MSYDHKRIDAKWQQRWDEAKIFEAQDGSKKDKYYVLVEFPYPSGAGLHVGHPRSYTALDIVARKKRMEGKNVLFPMGWDAFGLPAENYAIKTGVHPSVVTRENIDNFRRQLKAIGFSFDWSREVNTTDPKYYRWTQWMFNQFFKAGLAYKAKATINWCPKDKTGLANEEVVGGACERCGTPVEKREKEQWMIAITKYADRLLEDLNTVDYLPKIKKQQEDWIGKSEGAEIDFSLRLPPLDKGGARGVVSTTCLTAFTTRPDTIFGVTYIVLAPEHPWVKLATDDQHDVLENKEEVRAYLESVKSRTEIDRTNDDKEKTGVELKGVKAINPATGEEIPMWVADYVLPNYGTGVVMAVPAHDERDRAFAEKYALPIVDEPLVSFDEGIEKSKGRKKTNYRLRDWVFSRQRYWGEPIPLVHCEKDGWVAVPDEQLPVELPKVEKYEPTDSGESPLASIESFVNTTCPTCGGPAKRETDTMPNWAGSSWYFLRYIDPSNDTEFASKKALKYWTPVDLYNGGMEHTTLHLLYSRFWNKFLFDQGLVPTSEPYMRRHSHGLIMSEDGTKMSKSKGNVVNPDEVVAEYGADAFRAYILFMGPFEEHVPWSTNGLVGVRRFLDKVERLADKLGDETPEVTKALHKTIQKVSSDIESFRFNTAVSELMKFVNLVQETKSLSAESFKVFLTLLSPFAPHLANELWEQLGMTGLVEEQSWPVADEKFLVDDKITIVVQVNGKLRASLEVSPEISDEDLLQLAKADENVQKFLVGEIKKEIVVKGKLVNFVV
ncbi:MAG: class I tRNA ligase family protein [Patescibacteria group bacterium]